MTADLDLLSEAFVFGIPLVFNLDQVNRYVHEGVGANPAAPFNSFSHARTLAGPADTFVSINNDTVYSFAQIDLSGGPVTLELPDTAGRYYVMQFVDAWTNNFAYLGHRATGTAAQQYLLVPPGWNDAESAQLPVIHAPTTVFSIVGRWACGGDWDLAAVHELQDRTRLTPLDAGASLRGVPEIGADIPPALVFLEKLRLWSQALPPAASDRAQLASFATLGIGVVGESPYVSFPPERVAEWGAALESANEALVEHLRTGEVPMVNGWQLPYHAFHYNLDFFEVGTIDSAQYTSVPPAQKYLARAAAALGGLWGNHAYEAAYAAAYVDGNGEQLHGEHSYALTFAPTPPAKAFWSITMYSVPNFYLVDNAINRYSIGSTTEGIQVGEDGSLRIVMSAAEPADPEDRANWLPAPEGPFRPLLRMYEPDATVLDGTYVIPAITRLD